MSALLKAKFFHEINFGEVEWRPFNSIHINEPEDLIEIIQFLGTVDKDIINGLSAGVVVTGQHAKEIVGFKDFPEGFVPKVIYPDDIPFCENCVDFDSTRTRRCRACDKEVCEACVLGDSCCDKYDDI